MTSSTPFNSTAWVSTDPAGLGSTALSSLSCPTATFCAATAARGTYPSDNNDNPGTAVLSGNPETTITPWATAWFPLSLPVSDVICPTADVCDAVAGSNLVTTSDPTGGPWNVIQSLSGSPQATGPVNASGASIACPSTDLCVLGLSSGTIESVTTNVTPAIVHTRELISPPPCTDYKYGCSGNVTPLVATACADDHFCLTSGGGELFTSDPTAQNPTWVQSPAPAAVSSASCPAEGTCLLAAAQSNTVYVSTNAGSAHPDWNKITLQTPGSLTFPIGDLNIACASTQLCVIANPASTIVAQIDPMTGAVQLDQTNAHITSVSCVPDGPCGAVTATGKLLTATPHDPSQG